MGVGFIQLVTTGHEYNIFNKEPQITFFKIYYRRHTNFYINNYEIEETSATFCQQISTPIIFRLNHINFRYNNYYCRTSLSYKYL